MGVPKVAQAIAGGNEALVLSLAHLGGLTDGLSSRRVGITSRARRLKGS